MELYLDTASIDDIQRLARIYPISGVTTNPSIIAASGRPVWEVLPQIRELIGNHGKLFAQVISHHAEGMVSEAQQLRESVDDLIIKVPVTSEGLVAIRQLKQLGIPTLGTVVYSAVQGLMAALAGAEYIAPYVNRVDAQGGDGIKMVEELQSLLNLHAPDSKILAASFRTPLQATRCMLAGCAAITLPTEVIDLFLAAPAVTSAVDKFDSDWQRVFNRPTL